MSPPPQFYGPVNHMGFFFFFPALFLSTSWLLFILEFASFLYNLILFQQVSLLRFSHSVGFTFSMTLLWFPVAAGL